MFFIMFVFAGVRGSGDADYYNYLWFVKDLGVDYTGFLILHILSSLPLDSLP